MQAALHQIARDSPQLNNIAMSFENFCASLSGLLYVSLLAAFLTSAIATVYFSKQLQGRLDAAMQKLYPMPKRPEPVEDLGGDEIDQLLAELG